MFACWTAHRIKVTLPPTLLACNPWDASSDPRLRHRHRTICEQFEEASLEDTGGGDLGEQVRPDEFLCGLSASRFMDWGLLCWT